MWKLRRDSLHLGATESSSGSQLVMCPAVLFSCSRNDGDGHTSGETSEALCHFLLPEKGPSKRRRSDFPSI